MTKLPRLYSEGYRHALRAAAMHLELRAENLRRANRYAKVADQRIAQHKIEELQRMVAGLKREHPSPEDREEFNRVEAREKEEQS